MHSDHSHHSAALLHPGIQNPSLSQWDAVIPEKEYRAAYALEIEPGLAKIREEVYTEVRPGQSIYSLWYEAEHPVCTLMVSHGFTEGCRKYDELVYYCLQNQISVVVMAHAGHDCSYRLNQDPYLVHIDRFMRYVEDLGAVARKVRWHFRHVPLFLLGHSMGGGIAAAAAETYPTLFDGLILTSPMIRPLTGPVPWRTAKTLAAAAVRSHHETGYLPGHQPYHEETFEQSAGTSRARFEVYKSLRNASEHLQTSAATYQWLQEAGRMERYIFQNIQKLRTPVLLLQAGRDSFVSNQVQDAFFVSLPVHLYKEKVYIPLAKHEIYQSRDDSLPAFYHSLFGFIEHVLHRLQTSA